jgi:predicted nuclease of predicted toxin-antitoxin system
VRLLFDENLSILSAQWAAATLAVDVLDARAAGLAGKTDREVRRFAIETDRILVTLDADFGNLIRFSPSGTPGVIWLRPRLFERIIRTAYNTVIITSYNEYNLK